MPSTVFRHVACEILFESSCGSVRSMLHAFPDELIKADR